MIISKNAVRVERHTAPEINARIRRETQERVERLRQEGPEAARRRLRELDEEWDMERVLETNASVIALSGVVAALAGRRWGLALSAAVLGFLFQHAIQGWCPPVGFFRRRGVRTQREIEEERCLLAEASGGP